MKRYFAGILSLVLLTGGALLFFHSHFTDSKPSAPIQTVPLHTLHVAGIADYVRFSRDGKVLAVVTEPNTVPQSKTNGVELWNTRTWKRQRILPLAKYFVYFSPDSKTLFCANETVQEWNLATGRLMYVYKNSGDIVTFSPDRRFFAATEPILNRKSILMGLTLFVWNTVSHKRVAKITFPQAFISAGDADFSRDNHILAVDSFAFSRNDDSKGRSALWNAEAGQPITRPGRSLLGVQQTAFSPDGKLFAMTGKGLPLTLWDTSTWKQKWSVASGYSSVQDIEISSAGQIAVFGRDKSPAGKSRLSVTLCQTDSGNSVRRIAGAFEPEFSDNGKLLVTQQENGITVWKTNTGSKTAEVTVPSHLDPPVLSPDNKYLVTTQPDSGTVSVWNMPGQH